MFAASASEDESFLNKSRFFTRHNTDSEPEFLLSKSGDGKRCTEARHRTIALLRGFSTEKLSIAGMRTRDVTQKSLLFQKLVSCFHMESWETPSHVYDHFSNNVNELLRYRAIDLLIGGLF